MISSSLTRKRRMVHDHTPLSCTSSRHARAGGHDKWSKIPAFAGMTVVFCGALVAMGRGDWIRSGVLFRPGDPPWVAPGYRLLIMDGPGDRFISSPRKDFAAQ